MSFAPRDTHEAQVQFALERGVPAMIGIMATQRLPYPARAFDMAHCSRCLIPWYKFGKNFCIFCWFTNLKHRTIREIETFSFMLNKLQIEKTKPIINFNHPHLSVWHKKMFHLRSFDFYRWYVSNWSGQSSKAWWLLDSFWPSYPLEEILERMGKNPRRFEKRARCNWGCC